MTTKRKTAQTGIRIDRIEQGAISCYLKGASPLIMHRMGAKVKRILLCPPVGKKTAAEKAKALKHDPIAEFLDSMYLEDNDDAPTALYFPPEAFKAAMATAALRVEGVKKREIEQLLYVDKPRISIYGLPRLLMSVTRNSDMNRTPDIRTRAILSEWACEISIKFTRPILNDQSVANLLAAAGLICGIGDFRVEKGKGNFGRFDLVGADDPEYKRITEYQGRAQQIELIENVEFYDGESAELYNWFEAEVDRRGVKEVTA